VRPDFRAGFALTGIDVGKVMDARELRAALPAAIGGTRYGMVIVESELMADLDESERAAFAAVTEVDSFQNFRLINLIQQCLKDCKD
jgi:vacuolar-type H+-ATPase subunit F/Vma7